MAKPVITSFAAGEWSPKMRGRTDLDNHRQSCEQMENFFCLPQGPAIARPGTKYIAEAKGDDAIVRLIPFIHSNEQAYVLEFGDLYIRFYMDQGQIMDPGTPTVPYEIVSPYSTADLWGIDTRAQSADVMYLVHPDHPVYKLSRTAHTSWTCVAVDFADGPYLEQNSDSALHLRASAVSGTGVTITAEYLYDEEETGTYDDTLGSPEGLCTSSQKFGVFIFTAPNGKLTNVSIYITTGAASTLNMTCYLYASDGSKATGSVLATSDTEDVDTAGYKQFVFSPAYQLTTSSQYALVFGTASTDDAIRADVVDDNDDYVSGYAATATGAVTGLTSSADWRVKIEYEPTGNPTLFYPSHVGSKWRMRQSGNAFTTTFSTVRAMKPINAMQFIGAFSVECVANTSWVGRVVLQQSTNKVEWLDCAKFSTSTLQEFVETRTGVWYRLSCTSATGGQIVCTLSQVEHWGVFEITARTNAYTVTADIKVELKNTDPTAIWREGAWSGYRGYPRTGCFDTLDRLCFAGTDHQPLTIWRSAVGDYETFTPGTADDSAFSVTITRFANPIQWIDGALVGSLGEEGWITSPKNEPLSASNLGSIEIQSTDGTQLNTRPIQVGPANLFIQNGGRHIRQLAYNFGSNKYQADDLTFLADHITVSGIEEMVFQQTPYSILWARRDDGILAGMTHARIGDDTSKGWHRFVTDGEVKSICVVPSSYGDTDTRQELWMLVRRAINGSWHRYIEILADNEAVTNDLLAAEDDGDILAAQADYWGVDCGLKYDGAPATTITGLGHLEGETVAIWADGAPQAQQEVVSGAITLDIAASKVIVGKPFTCKLRPSRIELQAPDGTSQGRVKEISNVTLRVLNSIPPKVAANETDAVAASNIFAAVYELGSAPLLQSTDLKTDGWPSDTDTNGYVQIIHDQPGPLIVLAIMPVLGVNE